MKVFILGNTGMLGNYLYNYYKTKSYNTIAINRKILDVENIKYNQLENIFKNYDINENDIIINCIGIIKQRNLEDNSKFYKVNSIFPIMLDKYCIENKIKFIHITTDCIFNGDKGNYIETDLCDVNDDYGLSKYYGEMLNSTIIRTSIIGEEINNKFSLIEFVKSNKNGNIKGYNNHFWNGLTCLELAKFIEKVIKKDIYWKGIRHIFSPNFLSKYELCKNISEIFELNVNIEEYSCETKVDRTLNTVYNKDILNDIKTIEEQIKELKEYNLTYKIYLDNIL